MLHYLITCSSSRSRCVFINTLEGTTDVLINALFSLFCCRNAEEEKRTFIPLMDYILNVVSKIMWPLFCFGLVLLIINSLPKDELGEGAEEMVAPFFCSICL